MDVYGVFAFEAFVHVDEVVAFFGFIAIVAVLVVVYVGSGGVCVGVAMGCDLWALEAELVELMEEESGFGDVLFFQVFYELFVFVFWVWFVENVVFGVAEISAEEAVLA